MRPRPLPCNAPPALRPMHRTKACPTHFRMFRLPTFFPNNACTNPLSVSPTITRLNARSMQSSASPKTGADAS
eukprot:10678361-Lingulodinium_polyedra.AAC.1